jgi:cytochrome b561
MTLRNTAAAYGDRSKGLHWLIAALVLAMFVLAFTFINMEEGAAQKSLVAVHQSIGLVVLALALYRLYWRSRDPRPPLPASMALPERALARGVQAFLYAALLVLPVSGYVFQNAFGDEVTFFGLTMPHLVAKDREVRNTAWFFHQWTAYLVLAALALHVAGALYHHYVRRDEVLRRMLPGGEASPD